MMINAQQTTAARSHSYVITEGAFLPVIASICDSSNAASSTVFITSYESAPI